MLTGRKRLGKAPDYGIIIYLSLKLNRMKIFSWLSALFVLLVIIAAFTVPGDQQFAKFINTEKRADTMTCKPITGEGKKFKILLTVFSIHTVSYCETVSVKGLAGVLGKKNNDAGDTLKIAPAKTGFIRVTGTETYLGLFGRFWKI
jgi:hypothetical protein